MAHIFNDGDRVFWADDYAKNPTGGTVQATAVTKTSKGVENVYLVNWDDGIDNGEYFGEELVKGY